MADPHLLFPGNTRLVHIRKRRRELAELCTENQRAFLRAVARNPHPEDESNQSVRNITFAEVDQVRLLTVRYLMYKYSLSYDGVVTRLYKVNPYFRPNGYGLGLTVASLLGIKGLEKFDRIMVAEGHKGGVSNLWVGDAQVLDVQEHPIAQRLERLKETNILLYYRRYATLTSKLREATKRGRSKRRYRNNPYAPAVTA